MKIGTRMEHFRQSLSSQNIRNDVSEHQDFKIFCGSMFPTPLVARALGVCVIPFYILLKKVGHSEKEYRVTDDWYEIHCIINFTRCHHCHA